MKTSNPHTPGVYIHEMDASGIVPVATAVPAFIGYTPVTSYNGVPLLNIPTPISSFADFKRMFCYPDPAPPATPAQQYHPQYYLVRLNTKPDSGRYLDINDNYYSIVPDPDTVYYLYNSIRLFYENGGGNAFIISVGSYGSPSQKPIVAGEQIINTNVRLKDLTAGLETLANELEPTMYICPEATLLSVDDNAQLMQAMLAQCAQLQRAISIFDIIGARDPDPLLFMNDIETFRNNTGDAGLSYGTAYYPFISTSIMQGDEMNYTNLWGGDITQLGPLLNPAGNPNPAAAKVLAAIADPSSHATVTQNNNALLAASSVYSKIIQNVLDEANILPPSGAMAGVITQTDNEQGVWYAPANTGIVGAVAMPLALTEAQQGPLNVDPVSGKSINAIRFFNGQGILVWGARTLDGNSHDWRYLPVRRTLIYIEQSCRVAAAAYVFQPNNKNTWEAIKAAIAGFLTSVWKEGGLMGAKPADAFSVDCGLGITMTSDDILNGFMNITIKVAVTHPAEFIVITIQQQMAT